MSPGSRALRAAPLHVASAAVMGEGANSREKQTGGGRPQHNLLPLEAAGPFLHRPCLQDFVLVSGAKPATCNVQTSQHHRQRFPRVSTGPRGTYEEKPLLGFPAKVARVCGQVAVSRPGTWPRWPGEDSGPGVPGLH